MGPVTRARAQPKNRMPDLTILRLDDGSGWTGRAATVRPRKTAVDLDCVPACIDADSATAQRGNLKTPFAHREFCRAPCPSGHVPRSILPLVGARVPARAFMRGSCSSKALRRNVKDPHRGTGCAHSSMLKCLGRQGGMRRLPHHATPSTGTGGFWWSTGRRHVGGISPVGDNFAATLHEVLVDTGFLHARGRINRAGHEDFGPKIDHGARSVSSFCEFQPGFRVVEIQWVDTIPRGCRNPSPLQLIRGRLPWSAPGGLLAIRGPLQM